jgi:fructan beta-fructosidase
LNQSRISLALAAALACIPAPLLATDRPDLVIADFEGETYGAWQTTGTAFGPGPARGTLPNQMEVAGFLGKGLVNSYHGGDASTGTLTSPPFTLNRPYLNFLIGGGGYPGQTCIELIIDGKPVRSTTGPNDKPGGSERLEWAFWNISEFTGKTAVIRITDSHTGGWGHINVDQIVQSDTKRGIDTISRQIVLNHKFVHLPVKRDAPARQVTVKESGRNFRVFEIRLPEAGQSPDFWVFLELPDIVGHTLSFEARLPVGSHALAAITQSDHPPDADALYKEKDRPQFHFTSRRGWLNDPNGLVWHRGQYHLFYQHNPFGWEWGNMHWGHAISPDLLHWTELADAIAPREFGDWAFSGSAVVDHANESGFVPNNQAPIAAAYTSTGRGECIGYFFGEGAKTQFHEYNRNPVVKHQGRDPRLLWHKPTNRWIMAVYDELDGKQWIAFYSSPSLKQWQFESRIAGFFECPDLFELPIQGEPGLSLWVLYGADGAYMLGQFDGKTFTPQSDKKERVWYGNFYAAQTFSDTPDGRRIQIGWANGVAFPNMPFNQQMTIPCELTLRKTDDGIRMFARPIAELATLHGNEHSMRNLTPAAAASAFAEIVADALEIQASAEVGPDTVLTITLRGTPVIYDAAKRTLTCGDKKAPLALDGTTVRLQILLDRGSIEVFANDGRVAISHAVIPPENNRAIHAFITGPNARFETLDVFEIKSTWNKRL